MQLMDSERAAASAATDLNSAVKYGMIAAPSYGCHSTSPTYTVLHTPKTFKIAPNTRMLDEATDNWNAEGHPSTAKELIMYALQPARKEQFKTK